MLRITNRPHKVSVVYASKEDLNNIYYLRQPDPAFTKHADQILGVEISGFHCLTETNLPDLTLRKGTVVVRRLEANSSKIDRLNFGKVLRHEFAHAERGANEVEARLSEREYLQRNGLAGPSNFQILLTISSFYSASEREAAFRTVLGTGFRALVSGWIIRFIAVFDLGKEYKLESDFAACSTKKRGATSGST